MPRVGRELQIEEELPFLRRRGPRKEMLLSSQSDGSHVVGPIHAVPEVAPLDSVLDEFVRRRGQLFLAVDEHGGTAGIITLEDAIETLLGTEIVDETDRVVDMRKLAGRLFQGKLRGRPF